MEKLLKVSSSPHVRDGVTTQRLMFDVVIAMIPASVYGVWQFGMYDLFEMADGSAEKRRICDPAWLYACETGVL